MDKIKSGIATSEFWVGLFTIVFTYLVETLGWDVPKEAIIGTIAWAIAYIFARFGLKMRAVKIEADLKRLRLEIEGKKKFPTVSTEVARQILSGLKDLTKGKGE